MCGVVEAISVVSSIAGFLGQQQQASSQESALRSQERQNQLALRERAEELNLQASEDQAEAAREAMIERARLRVIGAERGGGNTSARIIREAGFQEGLQTVAIESNLETNLSQLDREARGSTSRSNAQIASISRPSLLSTGLQIGGSLAGSLKPSSSTTSSRSGTSTRKAGKSTARRGI